MNITRTNKGAVPSLIATVARKANKNHEGIQIKFNIRNFLKNSRLNFLLTVNDQITPFSKLMTIIVINRKIIMDATRKKKNPLTVSNSPLAAAGSARRFWSRVIPNAFCCIMER